MIGTGKRILSFLMAMFMVFSVIPVEAFAVGTEETHDHEHIEAIVVESDDETEPETQAPHEHVYTQAVTAPGCETAGYTTYTCACGDSYVSDEVAAIGHSYQDTVVAPTEDAQGYTEHTCSVCGHSYQDSFVEKLTSETEPEETEPEETESEETEPEETEPEEKSAYDEVQAEIDRILNEYLGTTEMTKDEIVKAVTNMGLTDFQAVRKELENFEKSEAVSKLTEEEIVALIDVNPVFFTFTEKLEERASRMTLNATSPTTIITGLTYTDSLGNGSLSGTTLTVKAQSSLTSPKTNTVTLTNISGATADLSFDFSASSNGGFSLSGASSPYTVRLANNESFSITIIGRSLPLVSDASLTLSNFTLTEVIATAAVTPVYDATLGSVTSGGTVLTSGTEATVTLSNGVTATPNSGVTFVGWINPADGSLLTTNTTYIPSENATVTVKAVLAKNGGTGVYMVGTAKSGSYKDGSLGTSVTYYNVTGTHIFEDLNTAAAFASANTSKHIVLLNDTTLEAGTHTIPSGVTLLIPFDNSNTLYTAEACSTGTYATPSAYRTLTLGSGANLVVNGELSLSGKHMRTAAGQMNGSAPSGPQGFIKTESGSAISVNNGGKLYAYGYIIGSGSVVINSGGAAYELFQIMDFRGGSQTLDMDNRVFPLGQYYVQNIEVPMTIHAGATEHSYTTIYMSSSAFGSSVAFIGGSGSMFNLSSGYVVKRYDGSKDRLIVDSYGSLSVSPIKMQVGSSILGGGSINSEEYVLGINGNISVNVHSGSISLNQDVAFLPGAELVVDKGATCNLGNGNKIYVYDSDVWDKFFWGNVGGTQQNVALIPVKYAPSKDFTRTIANMGDAKIICSGNVVASEGQLYTTSGDVAVSGTEGARAFIAPGTDTVTYQVQQNTSGDADTYTNISISSVVLKNGDGTTVTTGDKPAGTYTYTNGVWVFKCNTCTPSNVGNCTTDEVCSICGTVTPAPGHKWDTGVVTAEPTCTEEGLKTYTCSVCNEEKKEVISATGHTEVTIAGKAATCTETGLTEGKKCSVCNTVLVAQEVISVKGHTEETLAGKNPTCTETGLTEGTICSVCGETLAAQEAIPATGHALTHNSAVEATCTKPGKKEHWTCGSCGAIFLNAEGISQVTEDALIVTAKHSTGVKQDGKAADCVEAGWHEYYQCPTCEGYFEDSTCQYPIANLTSWKTEGEGLIPALNHPEESRGTISGKAATCTESGLTDGQKCNLCGEVLVAQEVIPAKGHQGEIVQKNATCMEAGYRAYFWCGCGNYIADADMTVIGDNDNLTAWKDGTGKIPATGHDMTFVAGKDPTCTEDGNLEYWSCGNCGNFYADEAGENQITNVTRPATNHNYGDVSYIWADENISCTATRSCQCGDIQTETVDAVINTVAATCNKEGNKTYTATFTTNSAFKEQVISEVLEKTSHEYEEQVTAPTCTAKGYTTHTCKNCGHSYIDAYVDSLAHSYTNYVSNHNATCMADGTKTASCDYGCGKSDTIEDVGSKLEHKFTNYVSNNNATCLEDGTKTASCDYGCGNKNTIADDGSAKGHSFGNWNLTKDATCVVDGEETRYCANCSQSEIRTVKATGHTFGTAIYSWTSDLTACTASRACKECTDEEGRLETETAFSVSEQTKAPNCTEKGEVTYTVTFTNTAFVMQTQTAEIAAIGHSYDEAHYIWTEDNSSCIGSRSCVSCGDVHEVIAKSITENVTKQPGCGIPGSKTLTALFEEEGFRTQTRDVEIPALEHDYKAVITAPTCTEAGYTTHTCANCGNTYQDTPIVALDHSFVSYTYNNDAKCGVDGTKTAKCIRCDVTNTITAENTALSHSYTNYIYNNDAKCEMNGTKTAVCDHGCGTSDTVAAENTALEHSYKAVVTASTCTEKGFTTYTCTRCGHAYADKYVDAKGHSYKDWEIVTEATCETAGSQKRGCYNCSEVETDEIPALNHDYVAVITAPTCTETGYTTYTCSRCSDSYVSDNVDALNHDYKTAVTAPTCTQTGYTTYTCNRCSESYMADEVDALGHDWNAPTYSWTGTDSCIAIRTCKRANCSDPSGTGTQTENAKIKFEQTKSPTCTEKGEMTYTAEFTNEAFETQTKATELMAMGHTFGTPAYSWETDYSACTASRSCTVENCDHKETEKAYATGKVTVEASCGKTGTKLHTTATFSNKAFVTQTITETLPALEHVFVSYTYDNNAKCGVDGTETAACNRGCGATNTRAKVNTALTHSFTSYVSDNNATCTADGTKTAFCDHGCGETETVADQGSQLEHAWDSGKVTTAASCVAEGEMLYTCTTCPEEDKATRVEIIPATDHKWFYADKVEPTCTQPGFAGEALCGNCGAQKTGTEIPATGHKWGTGTVTKVADCVNEGTMSYTCTVAGCGGTMTESIPALGHQEQAVKTKPTCLDKGYTTHTCQREDCDYKVVDTYVDALGHSFTSYVSNSDATCTADGTETAVCDRCDKTHTQTEVGSKLEHNYTNVATDPTCIEQGYTTYTCQNGCNNSYKDDFTAALGHSFTSYVSDNDATCTADGNKTAKCDRCDATDTIVDAGSKLGHNYGSVSYTWSSDNSRCSASMICSRCADEQEQTVETTSVTVDATCLEDGKITYSADFTANAAFVDQNKETAIEATGHSYGAATYSWEEDNTSCTGSRCCAACGNIQTVNATEITSVVTKTATCTVAGNESFTAVFDAEGFETQKKNVAIKMLGHSYDKVVTAPTCTAEGYTTYTCKNEGCNSTYVSDYVDMLPHNYKTVVTAPTCVDKGYTSYTCTDCGDNYKADETAAIGHNYDQHVTAPTCVDGGYTTYTCKNCDDEYVADRVDALGHSFINYVSNNNATCLENGTETAKCESCDATDTREEADSALGHSFTDYVFNNDSTCQEDGTETAKCSRCNVTDTRKAEESALGHSFTNYVSNKDATCIADGTETAKCDRCDVTDTHTDAESALGHDYQSVVTAPTCTEVGYTTYTCSRCDDIYVADQVMATGHNFGDWIQTKAPTCLAMGQEKRECACGENETRSVAAKGHDYDHVVVAPTCEQEGYTIHTCKVCGYSERDTYVDAQGHDYQGIVTAPTCEKEGYTTYICERCGDSYQADEIAATGHRYDKTVKAPTCTEAGYTTYTCSVCGDQEVKDAVPATGHDYKSLVTAPTCTEEGYTTYICGHCDDCYISDKVNAKGHTEVIDAAVAATCTTEGKTEGRHCSVCNEVLLVQEAVPAKGHTEVVDEEITATCTTDGKTAGKHCSVCNEVLLAQTAIPATGHDEVLDEAVASTCTTEGRTAGKHCAVCNEILVKQQIINAKGHTEVIDAAVAATCTTEGKTEGRHCSVCNEVLLAQEVIPAKNHTEVIDKEIAATCTTEGKTAGKHCSVCNEVLIAQTIVPAKGHTEARKAAVDATCTTSGLTEGKYCSICNEILEAQGVVPATGHDEVVDAAIEATCMDTGLTEGKHCSVCKEVIIKQMVIDAKGHKEAIDVAVAETCTTEGKTEGKHCSVCNEVLVAQQIIPAKGHKEEVIAAVEATCTESGLTEGVRCSVCDAILVDQETVPVLEHVWDEGVITTAATCTTEGVKVFTCSMCNGTRNEPVPELGHDTQQHTAQHPTHYSVGWEAYETCNRCDYSSRVQIPALGEPSVSTYESFMVNLKLLEEYAAVYARMNPGKDPMNLLIKYVRTGVDRYNSGSWNIMAGYEDADFAQFVKEQEESFNKAAESVEDMITVTGLKNIANFKLPNGDSVDFGHMFGTIDISYHNKNSVSHADVAGWAGDLVDLLSTVDRHGVEGTLDEMIEEISSKYLIHAIEGESDQFSHTDMYGDLDGFYVIQKLIGSEYESGDIYTLFNNYFTENLTDVQRAEFFLKNRLNGVTDRNAIREAVFNEYTSNKVVATLEGTREFENTDLSDLRMACCYAFADYLCKLAGDYVELKENNYFKVFSSESSTLAPGITQKINIAKTADNKQIRYYIATANINSEYVDVYANYKDADPSLGWGMARVRDQANAAQERYGNPESSDYIPNYNVIASINGAGYNMSTGEPSGLLVMGGVEYHAANSNGFFGILKNGKAMIGTTEEYNAVKTQVQEGIAGFGSRLIKDGEIVVAYSDNHTSQRASRTAVGITKTGNVVFMALDGRQEPVSCGGSMQEIAQIMLEAGCVDAINLDGGGSTTYVARPEGSEELMLISSPSDGFERSVSTSLIMVSTAPSSTNFDHAVLDTEYTYLTIGSSVQITASGVSPMGNAVDIPAGAAWAVSDNTIAEISDDGVITGLANGKVEVHLIVDGEIVGRKTMYVVIPDAAYFTKTNIDAVYGVATKLPVAAQYEGKPVAFNANDVAFILSNNEAGTMDGMSFIGSTDTELKNVIATVYVVQNEEATRGTIDIAMYNEDDVTFDFDNAVGGDRVFAWNRVVSNSTSEDHITYSAVDLSEPMVTSYTFAIDMTQIPIPAQLEDLIYMLPGADVEGANSAWSFLLQLAERVSVLTEVRPVIKIDPNMDVDYSEVELITDYFTLNEVILDEETNELSLVLKWVDQTKAIDPNTANPLCIVNGLKLTPKANAQWNSKKRLDVLNTGDVGYKIYLRASALYSFAQKEENQQIYGLRPFENKDVIIDGSTEKGAYFADTYATFTDEYILINGLKNGWIYEVGGYAYYVDGERYTGVQKVGGYYYDFGEDGINIGQTKYTGLFELTGRAHYAINGTLTPGWVTINGDSYCFDENGTGYDGSVVMDEVEMVFDNGKLVGGHTGFVTKSDGKLYHYVNGAQTFGWYNDGKDWYYFETDNSTGVALSGKELMPDDEARSKKARYDFAENGKLVMAYFNPAGFYYWAGLPVIDGWVKNGDDPDPDAWYRTNYNGHYFTDSTSAKTITFYDATDGVAYTLDNTNGKLIQGGVVNKNNMLYYYWAGQPRTDGWIEHDDNTTYYAYSDGHLAKGCVIIDGKNYMFNDAGVLVTSGVIVEVNMIQNNTKIDISILNAQDEKNVKIAIWPEEAGQNGYIQWLDCELNDDGVWHLAVPMCLFDMEGSYVMHIMNGENKLLVATWATAPKAVDHQLVEVEEKLATCEETGAKAHWKCMICGELYADNKGEERTTIKELEIPLADHTYDNDKDATCNVCGYEREVEPEVVTLPVYRLYNPYTLEHLFTGGAAEKDALAAAGWIYEGIAWYAPTSGIPVYRLYNPYTDGHFYTVDEAEMNDCVAAGWKYDGIVSYAVNPDAEGAIPVFRLFNPYETKNYHHYTAGVDERDTLEGLGWIYEGIAWHALVK